MTAREAMELLVAEGFFRRWRSVRDIMGELSGRGWRFAASSVRHALRKMVKDGVLERKLVHAPTPAGYLTRAFYRARRAAATRQRPR